MLPLRGEWGVTRRGSPLGRAGRRSSLHAGPTTSAWLGRRMRCYGSACRTGCSCSGSPPESSSGAMSITGAGCGACRWHFHSAPALHSHPIAEGDAMTPEKLCDRIQGLVPCGVEILTRDQFDATFAGDETHRARIDAATPLGTGVGLTLCLVRDATPRCRGWGFRRQHGRR